MRPALVRGYDALACARHSTAEVDLPIPDGHQLSVTHDVAGHFTGYTVAKSTWSQAQAVHRAASILAAAQGRPAPAPTFGPIDDDIDPRLVAAFTAALGPDGWEIADWQREGRDYVVKVYTDFGWAGFLDGRPAEIAGELAALRAKAQTSLDALRCPSCDALLDPFAELPQPCGCGSVAWRPLAWMNAWDSMRGALPYLDGAVDPETLTDLARLTAALAGGCEPAGEWIQYDDDFTGVVQAYQELVPDARWTLLHDRPVAVIPIAATLRPGLAAQLLTAADEIGYELTSRMTFEYGNSQTVLRFQATEPVDGRETWFACARVGDRIDLVVGQPDWSPPFEDDDDHWHAMEETEDWWLLRPEEQLRHGPWTVERCPSDFTYGTSALAAIRFIPGDDLSAEDLRTALAEATLVINKSRTELEDHYAQLRAHPDDEG
ncbi:hypothetical protein [Actinoplanes sp. NPDC026670]|uniref:hypothetical protein n=1 Tax=Actinoplanes sp. NPDC026670 TaxID=3154700 RepID=UPI0033CBF006